VLAGKLDRAQSLFESVVAVANDLGLLSEEYDTVARRLTGNFPQALTHIALVNTAHNLSEARKPAVQRGATEAATTDDRAPGRSRRQ
jgi:GH15 family glucan-1,4-alpha-glucosidase